MTRSRTVYRIRVGVHLDDKWSSWFSGFDIAPLGEDETLLEGAVPDQAALHAVLTKIRDLGLPLLSVHRVGV